MPHYIGYACNVLSAKQLMAATKQQRTPKPLILSICQQCLYRQWLNLVYFRVDG